MLNVELDIYSGTPNPEWTLSGEQERELLDRLTAQPWLMAPVAEASDLLGYRGFLVSLAKEDDESWSRMRADAIAQGRTPLPTLFRIGAPVAEGQQQGASLDDVLATTRWLSETAGDEVSDYLRTVVDADVQASPAPTSAWDVLTEDMLRDVTPEAELEEGDVAVGEATDAVGEVTDAMTTAGALYRCNSNYLTGTNFSFWNHPAYIGRNNCYCFAANHRANVRYATPGRRARRPARNFSAAELKAALYADGWRETCRPLRNLTIALAVWPNTDFHFYRIITRIGAFSIWGHKPGGTAARYTDNARKVITSPRACNRGPYTRFDGYWYHDNARAFVS